MFHEPCCVHFIRARNAVILLAFRSRGMMSVNKLKIEMCRSHRDLFVIKQSMLSGIKKVHNRLPSAWYTLSVCAKLHLLRYETGRSHSLAWLPVKRSADCDRAVSLWRARKAYRWHTRTKKQRRREEGLRGFMVSNFYDVTNMRVPCHLYLQVQVAGH